MIRIALLTFTDSEREAATHYIERLRSERASILDVAEITPLHVGSQGNVPAAAYVATRLIEGASLRFHYVVVFGCCGTPNGRIELGSPFLVLGSRYVEVGRVSPETRSSDGETVWVKPKHYRGSRSQFFFPLSVVLAFRHDFPHALAFASEKVMRVGPGVPPPHSINEVRYRAALAELGDPVVIEMESAGLAVGAPLYQGRLVIIRVVVDHCVDKHRVSKQQQTSLMESQFIFLDRVLSILATRRPYTRRELTNTTVVAVTRYCVQLLRTRDSQFIAERCRHWLDQLEEIAGLPLSTDDQWLDDSVTDSDELSRDLALDEPAEQVVENMLANLNGLGIGSLFELVLAYAGYWLALACEEYPAPGYGIETAAEDVSQARGAARELAHEVRRAVVETLATS
jgi:phosphorylase superfamily protein